MSRKKVGLALGGVDIVIEPRVEPIGVIDFHRAEECRREGELAAQESIPEMKRLLA